MNTLPTVEINGLFERADDVLTGSGITFAITPPIDGNYWLFRVPVSAEQAIIAFPKFFTIGIGFQVEKSDWNTNLPYTCDAEMIYDHIEDNKGDETISRETCIAAIQALQASATQYAARYMQ